MTDTIKNFYFALEDKWYAGLDFLDHHGLPVYKIVDPIDKRIPSFSVFSILVLLLAFTFLFSFGGFVGGGETSVIFQIVDGESSPLPNVPVTFSYGNNPPFVLVSDTLGKITFTVPGGTTIDYSIDVDKYELVKSNVLAGENTLEIIQLSELQTGSLTKTIKLTNSIGQPVLGEAVLTFTCNTAYGVAPNPISGTSGTFVVTPNANCIPLSVSISISGYEDVQSFPITAEKDFYPIILTPKLVKDATLIVNVHDAQNTPIGNLDVSLQVNGIITENGSTDALGTHVFSVAAGDYTIVASDPVNGVYVSVQKDSYVASGQTQTVDLTITKNAGSTLVTSVIDKTSSNPLKDVIIKLKQGNTVLFTGNSNADGKVSVPIPDKTLSYSLSASREGYISTQQTISGSATTATFSLTKGTNSNTAKLFVHLSDQDGDPVADAKVALYNADTGFLSPYESVTSDSNGTATFKTVVNGNYKAFAYKASLTGFSPEHFFDIADDTTHDFYTTVNVPDGVVNIHVVDTLGNPVPFALVSVYNSFKNQLIGSDLTDTNGTYTLPSNNQKSKADKDVYMIVRKQGYSTLTTIAKPILPETTQTFELVLPPTQPNGNVKIELVGLYQADGKIVTGVGKGKDYTARFRVTVPEEHDTLDEMVVHLRTGEKDIVEKDDWYIQKINFPRAQIVKGSSWDPNNGVNIDGESITFGPAKWTNAIVVGPNPGTYEVETTLHVRETVSPQDLLKIFYKVFAQNDDELRDPIDANPVEELYANTKSATYQAGVTTSCDTNFCFDASILDDSEQLIEDVTEQYNADIFKDYTLTFNLLNNGKSFHTNSNIRIKSSGGGISLENYSLYNANGQQINGVFSSSENEDNAHVVMGNFTPQKKVGGTIHFTTRQTGTSVLSIELVSDLKVVFSKTILVNITGNKELVVTYEPTTFPSQLPITLMVDAKDNGTQNEVGGATVSLETSAGVVLVTEYTDGAGHAEIELPAQFAGKKILLKVEKAEYNPYSTILEVSDKVVSIVPETIGISINTKTEAEQKKSFTITNETSLPIIITKLELQGNLDGLLDKEKINSSLLPYVGVSIAPHAQLTATMTSVITPEAAQLGEHVDLEAVLALEVKNYGTPWAKDIPVKYSLGVSSEVDDPTCFNATPASWVTSTDGRTVTYEFQLQNNCSIKGTPTLLKELKVKANWQGNELGETVFTVFEQNNPTAIGAAKARKGYFSPVLGTIPPQDILIARLDFTPHGGVKGQGLFDIVFEAVNPIEGKPQLLTDAVHGEIAVVNLTDCIAYDKEILDLVPGKNDEFTIESKGCGSPVDVTLQSELELSSKQFVLQGTDKKTITVNDNQLDQGQYPIYVQLEGNEDKIKSQNKVLRARIRDPNACLQLNRYELDVFDDPSSIYDGFDTARLDNLCTEQKVSVKVTIKKDWHDSLRKGLVAGTIAFAGTVISNIANDRCAFSGNKVECLDKKEEEKTPGAGNEASANSAGTVTGSDALEGITNETQSVFFFDEYKNKKQALLSTAANGSKTIKIDGFVFAVDDKGNVLHGDGTILGTIQKVGNELRYVSAGDSGSPAGNVPSGQTTSGTTAIGTSAGSVSILHPDTGDFIATMNISSNFERTVEWNGVTYFLNPDGVLTDGTSTYGTVLQAANGNYYFFPPNYSGTPPVGITSTGTAPTGTSGNTILHQIQYPTSSIREIRDVGNLLYVDFKSQQGRSDFMTYLNQFDVTGYISTDEGLANIPSVLMPPNTAYEQTPGGPYTFTIYGGSSAVSISAPSPPATTVTSYTSVTFGNGVAPGTYPLVWDGATPNPYFVSVLDFTSSGEVLLNDGTTSYEIKNDQVLLSDGTIYGSVYESGNGSFHFIPTNTGAGTNFEFNRPFSTFTNVYYSGSLSPKEVTLEFTSTTLRNTFSVYLQNNNVGKFSTGTGNNGSPALILPAGTTYNVTSGNYHFIIPKIFISTVSPAPSIPSTGLAVLLQNNLKESDPKGNLVNAAVGGAANGLLGGLGNIASWGTGNAFWAFGLTTLAVGLVDYYTTDDKEFTVSVTGTDLNVSKFSVIAGEKGADSTVADTDIEIQNDGKAINPTINTKTPNGAGVIESNNLTFRNISQFVNESIFRNLLLEGKRYTFTKNLNFNDNPPTKKELDQRAEKEDFATRFHLQFNSFTPEQLANTAVPPIALSCDTFSEKTGKTGENALPHIAFAWNFNQIDYDACDQGKVDTSGNAAHIYCDATQFSIETIQKVELLKEFIETNAPFNCPVQDALSGNKTQTIPAADIGISSLNIDKIGATDVNMIVGLINNTPTDRNITVSVSYTLKGTNTAPSVQTLAVNMPVGGSKKNIGFVKSGLTTGEYELTASIVLDNCPNCQNATTATDTLSTSFFIGTTNGLVACEPFTTKRLGEFIAATEAAGNTLTYPSGLDKDDILGLVNFRTHLMQDRFSPDFFTDFDRYASKVSFFDAPTYYLDSQTGINRFFTNRNKWIVTREGLSVPPEGYFLPGPGVYDATIDISFETNDMAFFANGEPEATIQIFLEKTSTIEDNSPFYSIPFNGLIGTDDGQGRVGYGVNFSGEKVIVNENASEQLTTIDIPDSTPVVTLQTNKTDSYSILNSLERGNLLTVTQSGGNTIGLKWSPSYATPVLMKITNDSAQSDVYGYYSIGVNGDTSQSYIGAQGNPWYGVGINCRDFQDQGLVDVFSPRYDTSAINADCALVGAQENISYGFEWCSETIHTGDVNLKTIFYTPQGTQSEISRVAWKSNITFVSPTVNGGTVPLNGTPVLSGNSAGDELSSIEEILSLVKEEAICVRNSGTKTEFFWNPKEIFNVLETQENTAAATCIVK